MKMTGTALEHPIPNTPVGLKPILHSLGHTEVAMSLQVPFVTKFNGAGNTLAYPARKEPFIPPRYLHRGSVK